MAYWVEDGFDTWPEVVRAGTAAAGLYLRCGVWLARNLANGRIADAVIPVEVADSYGTVEWRRRLVDVGLWRIEGAGYRDLRHFDLNPTLQQSEDRRAKRAAAGRLGGLQSGKSRQRKGGSTRENLNGKQVLSKRQANASTLLEPPALPSPPKGGEGQSAGARERAPAPPPTGLLDARRVAARKRRAGQPAPVAPLRFVPEPGGDHEPP